jgi:hypothetical protein
MRQTIAMEGRICAATRGRAICARRVILDDHARLPWRFFGRLTAAVQAGLRFSRS